MLFAGHPVDPPYLLALYYNQIVGSAMKAHALFHGPLVELTRQKTTLDRSDVAFDQAPQPLVLENHAGPRARPVRRRRGRLTLSQPQRRERHEQCAISRSRAAMWSTRRWTRAPVRAQQAAGAGRPERRRRQLCLRTAGHLPSVAASVARARVAGRAV